jgi:phosphate transport system substrate-binding protein
MPANDRRHHHTTHRTRASALSAGAAIIALTLAACTTTSSSTSTSSSEPGTTAAAASGPHMTLTGAGSTFDAPFFDLAFANYHQQHPGVTVNYADVGSSAGITAFAAKRADFGASDVPMTAAEQAAAKGGQVVQVPVDLGAEGVVYNLSLPAAFRLHLTGPVIARIFLGQITSWHDPAITALNPGINLPSAPISVVHRADGSGTTYIFSNYLSTCPQPGRPRSAPGNRLTGRSGREQKAMAGWPLRSTAPRSQSGTSSSHIQRACSCLPPPSATGPAVT